MKRKSVLLLVLLLILSVLQALSACTGYSRAVRYQVAIFTPLYLDSAFDETTCVPIWKNISQIHQSRLEFYEGAQLAIDSLNKEGINLISSFTIPVLSRRY